MRGRGEVGARNFGVVGKPIPIPNIYPSTIIISIIGRKSEGPIIRGFVNPRVR